MKSFFKKLSLIVTDPDIRLKIAAVLGLFVVFRLLASIPVPGVNTLALAEFLQGNQLLGLLNIFAGGGLSQLSLVMLGVGPYITGSIILQLLTSLSPKLKAMYHEEGQVGREKFYKISRIVTVPIAFIQGFGLLTLLSQQGILDGSLISMSTSVAMVVAGSLLAMWIGERISEFGIGNGVSMIIFAGIVASFPQVISQLLLTFDPKNIPMYVGILVLAVIIIAAVIVVTEAERPVPIAYTRQVRGGKTYGGVSTHIPIRINQAGVMPIIFALSILMLPQMVGQFFTNADSVVLQNISIGIQKFMADNLWYGIVYFVLVVLFTYFYTAITFEPHTMAENLQKNGAFVPGVRPGKQTEEYLGVVVSRITLVGALFLGIIAIIPIIIQGFTGMQNIALGGTGVLIVVSVVIDVIKKLEAMLSIREY
jgi:preprotein translocase subunit SecY